MILGQAIDHHQTILSITTKGDNSMSGVLNPMGQITNIDNKNQSIQAKDMILGGQMMGDQFVSYAKV